MKTIGATTVFCAIVFVGYLLHTPIPDDMADPWYFRLLVAGLKAGDLITSLSLYLLPSDPNFHVRALRVMTELGLPSPDRQVPGSNITAEYAEFDGVRVLVYEPVHRFEYPVPGLVFFHGGGYALGSTRSHGQLTRRLAERLNMVLVSVDYRLAPENPLPAGPNDGVTATKYFLQHASEFGVDPHRVVVAGDSAGGHLTAVVVQEIHDDPTVPDIKLQTLFYPWIQVFDLNTPSYQLYGHTFGELGLSQSKVAAFVAYNYCQKLDAGFQNQLVRNSHTSAAFKRSHHYRKVLNHDIIFEKLQNASQSGLSLNPTTSTLAPPLFEKSPLPPAIFSTSASPPSSLLSSILPEASSFFLSPSSPQISYEPEETFYDGNDTLWSEMQDYVLPTNMSPLMREDMRGLPKAFVATGDQDLLRDDGIFYAHALEQAGVEVTWRNYAGAWHGIAGMGAIADIPTGNLMLDDAIQFITDNI